MPARLSYPLRVGAGPGLGGALARRFAREGYRVAAVRRRHGEELAELCGEIEAAGGRARASRVGCADSLRRSDCHRSRRAPSHGVRSP